MNKIRKNGNDREQANLVAYTDTGSQLETKSLPGQQSTDLHRSSSQVWKPLVIDRYPENTYNDWISMICDLLHSFEELAQMLQFELQHRSWLNAYLLAAGMNQIVEDYQRADPFRLGKASKYLDEMIPPVGGWIANFLRENLTIWHGIHQHKLTMRNITAWQAMLADFINALAEVVMAEKPATKDTQNYLRASGDALLSIIPQFPATLRNVIIRLPSCFRSFDEQPEDLRRITDEFAIHWPEQYRDILLVGIRTSGSYLAPLYQALLKNLGYQNISILTFRPGSQLTSIDRSLLHEISEMNGLALVCDDPPMSGATLVKTTAMLKRAGIKPGNIILLLQLFGDTSSLPTPLRVYPSVLMSWRNWSINRSLEPESIKNVLSNACVPDLRICEVDRLPDVNGIENRQHIKASFRVKVVDPITNQQSIRLVQAKGVGLGYFGEHALAVAQRLPEYSAQPVALYQGLFLQDVPMPTQQLTAGMLAEDSKWLGQLVNYVLERNQQLPARQDTSFSLHGRNAVWEVASNILSTVFGRGWVLARLPLIDPYIKRILKTTRPSIIDGEMALRHWYIQDTHATPMVKMNLAERDFSHMDLFSYDPVYDLADLALQVTNETQSFEVRNAYQAISGERISPERWMLYKLVHLWDLNRQDPTSADYFYRQMARVVEQYYAEIYFQDLQEGTSTTLCALDIDGVLETNQLGFPSLTPTSARTLYSLAKHGYRVILATGRSLGELQERCEAYKLAGGVAEYGAVLYDHNTGQVIPLLNEDERGELYGLRGRLSNKPDVYLDPGYRFAVRAYSLNSDGKRIGLSDEMISMILSETDTTNQIYTVPGVAQTDFMVKRLNKGVGLKEWMLKFNQSRSADPNPSKQNRPLDLAVGDSPSDISMFSLAKLAIAPAHARAKLLRTEVRLARHPYQRGLEEAVTLLLGHKPGSCPTCQMKSFSPETSYMQDLLAVQENGPINMIWQAIRLYLRKGHMFHVSK